MAIGNTFQSRLLNNNATRNDHPNTPVNSDTQQPYTTKQSNDDFDEQYSNLHQRKADTTTVQPKTLENIIKDNSQFNQLFDVNKAVAKSMYYKLMHLSMKNMLKNIFLPIAIYENIVDVLTNDKTPLMRALQAVTMPFYIAVSAVMSLVFIAPIFIITELVAKKCNTSGKESKDLIKNLCDNICDNIECISKNENKQKIIIDHKQRQQLINLINPIFLNNCNIHKAFEANIHLFSEDFIDTLGFNLMIIKICENLKLTEDFSECCMRSCSKAQEAKDLSSVQQNYFGMLEDAFSKYNEKIQK